MYGFAERTRSLIDVSSVVSNNSPVAQGKLHLLKFDDVTQLRDFFKYTGNGSIIVSGHRGGYEEGYSENCIEGLEMC